MTPEMIGVIITAGSGLIFGGIAWGKTLGDIKELTGDMGSFKETVTQKISDHIKDDYALEAEIKNKVQKQWEWKDNHEKDTALIRLETQKQMAILESKVAVHDNQFTEIMRLLASINAKFEKLEIRLDGLHIHQRESDSDEK